MLDRCIENPMDDLNWDILIELDRLNTQLMRGRPYSRRMLFEEIKRKALKPLPKHRFEIQHKNYMLN